jgi:hypothetical protein
MRAPSFRLWMLLALSIAISLVVSGCSFINTGQTGGTGAGQSSSQPPLQSGSLVVAVNGQGASSVFARQSVDGSVWHNDQKCATCGWSGWSSLGGQTTSSPSAVTTSAGGFALFARGKDGAIWYREQSCATCSWSDWASLGGLTIGTPVATVTKAGGTVIFIHGTDGNLWRKERTCLTCAWGTWSSLGLALPS